jgi:small subunit ribosomal protein S9
MADEEHPESTEEEAAITDAVEDATAQVEQETNEPAGERAAGEEPTAAQQPATEQEPVATEESVPAEAPVLAEESTPAVVADAVAEAEEDEDEEEPAPREKPSVPGAHLEVDIVPEGVDPLGRSESYEDAYAVDPYAIDEEPDQAQEGEDEQEEALTEPISTAAIDLASGARYRATGKRKSAIARVTLRPGTGSYLVNGRTLEDHFPRLTLQRNIRQPLETVGYQDRMDVVARLHGGGISAQAGALRHGVSRALLEADPNLRGELKRRGFLTRDSRAKERKKAGLKKARKRPQFSKR